MRHLLIVGSLCVLFSGTVNAGANMRFALVTPCERGLCLIDQFTAGQSVVLLPNEGSKVCHAVVGKHIVPSLDSAFPTDLTQLILQEPCPQVSGHSVAILNGIVKEFHSVVLEKLENSKKREAIVGDIRKSGAFENSAPRHEGRIVLEGVTIFKLTQSAESYLVKTGDGDQQGFHGPSFFVFGKDVEAMPGACTTIRRAFKLDGNLYIHAAAGPCESEGVQDIFYRLDKTKATKVISLDHGD